MVKNTDFALEAGKGVYLGTPYKELDCQALVEKILADCGISRNWRGSNDMWRNAVHSHTVNDGAPPPGALVFTIKHDGKEDKKRYTDGVNAAHVGVHVGGGRCIHSTTGGVQWSNIKESRWTHYALLNDIDYNSGGMSLYDMVLAIYNKLALGTFEFIEEDSHDEH